MGMKERSVPSVLPKESSSSESVASDSTEKGLLTEATKTQETIVDPEMLKVWGELFNNPAMAPHLDANVYMKAVSASWVKSNDEVIIQKKETIGGTVWVVYYKSTTISKRYDTFLEAAIEASRLLDPDTYNDIAGDKV